MSHDVKCLLILDDDAAVGRTIGFIAEGQGFVVHCFEAPDVFLAAVQDMAPSHVALDLIMPGMDGIEVLRRLAELDCQSALILTSGMGQKVLESAQATASERGLNIVGVLPKPFRPQLLRDLLCRSTAAPVRLPQAELSEAVVTPELLDEAIRARAITIVAQPKLDLLSREVVGAEILARWTDPAIGVVPPDVFIGLAEAHGMMDDLTRLVLEQAVDWFSRSALSTHGSIAVNLSTSCLTDVQLADRIEATCRASGVAPERLILEITESTAMSRTADSFDTVTRLRLKGFHLSVDDFGTGYSSLAQLARLPLSEIKIDKSFVTRLLSSQDARKIVDATIRLAKGMGLVSVAEGVEDEETLQALVSLGCSLAQGYHISRPLPVADFDRWLDLG
ncbi:EAL domain-containing response regulator [Xanthomonadaceae bacterium JHOS43]|nr:EAL domain-containing response regulator [Xanthomonadaceae bacterium JHOS43]MCX7562221.1 EAL domain-containing response regulator [Xanthomonadaceae bacterium XH05]